MLKTKQYVLLIFILLLSLNSFSQRTTVVVAANLKIAMDSILTIYKTQYPNDAIQVSYGSSGKFYEQILNGAPFDLFFSADMNYPNQLKEKNATASDVKLYALGNLVIWSKKLSPKTKGINSLLDSKIKKIAIANPETAPYGAKAFETLAYYSLNNRLKSKLVYGENIAQTAQFITLGAADIGFIALSDALSPALLKLKGNFYRIPAKCHSPLEQGCVVLKNGQNNPVAKRFYDYISTKKAVEILNHFGYSQK
ncbi:molybdate ABC transporter substrate-binding protein [Flavobacterium sp.]|uniref:molybdate ABC transporter substrate-binding protein n=1 Tax=Flavobacterium sp. TaxID=239 RepID=UPI003C3999E9